MRVILVAGARPNFIKAAPLIWAARNFEIDILLVRTGQHQDREMSQVFLDELGLPSPRYDLGLSGSSRGEFVALCRERLEEIFSLEKPDWVVVVGDANSTLAGALAASRQRIRVAHVEAGLRSFDPQMPEEQNRVEVDSVSDLLFVTEPAGVSNLQREGRPEQHIRLVGNVMVDTLDCYLPLARERNCAGRQGLEEGGYAVLTLHHPSNVDRPEHLQVLCDRVCRVQEILPVVFPMHPRTRARLEAAGLLDRLAETDGIRLLEPLGYLDFLSLTASCRVTLTDSGGIQEETTVLGVPCLTLRDNTERPITIEQGTNRLVGARGERLLSSLEDTLLASDPKPRRPDLWDGHAAERIMRTLNAAG